MTKKLSNLDELILDPRSHSIIIFLAYLQILTSLSLLEYYSENKLALYINLFGFAVPTLWILYTLVAFLRRSKNGLLTTLSLEKNFLISEAPNILQFFSLISIVSLIVSAVDGRLIITLAIGLMLYFYLNLKRPKYISSYHTKASENYRQLDFLFINLLSVILITLLVFWLTDLIAASEIGRRIT